MLLLAFYPLIVLAGIVYEQMLWMILGVVALFVLRLLGVMLSKPGGAMPVARKDLLPLTVILAVFGIALSLGSALLGRYQLLFFYPVVVSLGLLVLFAGSLYKGMPMVERIARLQDPDLPAQAVAYTRKVTQVWCCFFLLNSSIALATCLYGDMKVWGVYNGVISYVLLGTLMAGEWLVRKKVQRKNAELLNDKN